MTIPVLQLLLCLKNLIITALDKFNNYDTTCRSRFIPDRYSIQNQDREEKIHKKHSIVLEHNCYPANEQVHLPDL
jgi:hypothetical protein